LVVPALDGDPGIYSARWAGPAKDFGVAMEKVWTALAGKAAADEVHRAYFVSVLSLAWPDGHVESFEGRVHGTLVWPPRGDKGFGYDPMFRPDGHDITFGEMDQDLKHRISHRADAFRQLIDACFSD
jgi:XTP/dITP diphosphohydrolase